MNLFGLINNLNLDNLDADEVKHVASRRGFFTKGANVSVQALMALAPVAAIMLPKVAKAATPAEVEVLNFALTLEFLENEFYQSALASSSLNLLLNRTSIAQIAKQENAHVSFLVTALGSAAVSKPNFDFTARGAFPDVFSNYDTFLAVAQSFEDTGVRAYKGQAGGLMGDNGLLDVGLQIHSVEARHAAYIRKLRGQKSWISGNDSGGAPAAIYANENNTTHAGVNVTSLAAGSQTSAYSEAFDEPLTKDQVLAIVTPFLA